MKKLHLLILIAWCWSPVARPTELEHFGTAFALTTIGYGFSENVFKLPPNHPFSYAFVDTFTLGMLAFAEADKTKFNVKTFGAGLGGMLLSNACTFVFRW